jgi:Phytanoyl-CoA dioxygenase (PhyH)
MRRSGHAAWLGDCFAVPAMIEALTPSSFETSHASSDVGERVRRSFAADGYVVFEGIVDKERLAAVRADILAEYERAKTKGALFSGGGTMSGHLNCFPGAGSRFVYDTLQARGIFDIVHALSTVALRAPNVGCNLNLPGSHPQNEHVDGYAAQPFLIVNVATVDTDLTNGAMEVLPCTHLRPYKYWQLLVERPERRRLCMKRGDVVIRTSALWHRGMANHDRVARPMLAFTWEDGGTSRLDPYDINGGRIAFLPNRFGTAWLDRVRERAFVAAPRVGTAYHAVRSLLR